MNNDEAKALKQLLYSIGLFAFACLVAVGIVAFKINQYMHLWKKY